jgi:PKD repeat protein
VSRQLARRVLATGAGATLLVLLATTDVAATTYYVSPSGNDANPGSAASPWKSIARANAVLGAGDTAILRGGTYREAIRPANSGSSENARITYQAAPGESVVLDGSGGRLTGWTKESGTDGVDAIYRRAYSGALHQVFQDDFPSAGKHVILWNMGLGGPYNSNPNNELHLFDPSHDWASWNGKDWKKHDGASQYKLANGVLRVRTWDARSPDAHNVRAAILDLPIDLSSRAYVTVDGVKAYHWKRFAVLTGGHHCVLKNCDLRYAGGWSGIAIDDAANSQLLNTVVQGVGSYIGHVCDAITINGAADVRVEGCDISYGGHSNAYLRQAGRLLFRGNYSHDPGGTCFAINFSSDNGLIENNVFARAAKIETVSLHMQPHVAVGIIGSNNVIRRNVISDSGAGIGMSCNDTYATSNGNRIYNNTIIGCQSNGLGLAGYAAGNRGRLNGNEICNNVFSGNGTAGSGAAQLYLDLPDGANAGFWENKVHHNLFDGAEHIIWYGNHRKVADAERQYPATFQSNVSGDPRFVNAGAGDLHLRADSPAVDRGADMGQPYAGKAPDMGAFELNGTGGPGNPPNTSPPSGGAPPDPQPDPGPTPQPAPSNQSPTARATVDPATGPAPLGVRFGGSGTDADGRIVSYRWKFGDGENSTVQNPSHTYVRSGKYSATLTVTDDRGATGTARVTVTAIGGSAAPTTAQLRPSDDTYVRDGPFAGQNYGRETVLIAKAASTGFNRQAFVGFDIASLRGGPAVRSARLRLYSTYTAADLQLCVVRDPSWREGTLTWNSKPRVESAPLARFATTAGTTVELDVTAHVQGELAGTSPRLSFAILATRGGADGPVFASREGDASRAAVLILSFAGAGIQTVRGGDGVVRFRSADAVEEVARRSGGDTGQGEGAVALRPTADAYVQGGPQAPASFGASSSLWVTTPLPGGPAQVSYLKFDLGRLGARRTLAATLRLYVRSVSAGSATVTAGDAQPDSWEEDAVTWDSRPALSAGSAGGASSGSGTTSASPPVRVGSAGSYVELDLTRLVRAAQDAGRRVLTLAVTATEAASVEFASREDEARTPELVVK